MKSFKETRSEILKNPYEAAEYLNAAFEQGNSSLFMMALKNVAQAHGGMVHLSRKSKLNRGNLYRILSKKGNPGIQNLERLLEAFGLKLFVGVNRKIKKAA